MAVALTINRHYLFKLRTNRTQSQARLSYAEVQSKLSKLLIPPSYSRQKLGSMRCHTFLSSFWKK